MPVSNDAVEGINVAKGITGAASDIASVISTPFNLYENYKLRKIKEKESGLNERKMNQDYIEQERKRKWLQGFQNRMLGL